MYIVNDSMKVSLDPMSFASMNIGKLCVKAVVVQWETVAYQLSGRQFETLGRTYTYDLNI